MISVYFFILNFMLFKFLPLLFWITHLIFLDIFQFLVTFFVEKFPLFCRFLTHFFLFQFFETLCSLCRFSIFFHNLILDISNYFEFFIIFSRLIGHFLPRFSPYFPRFYRTSLSTPQDPKFPVNGFFWLLTKIQIKSEPWNSILKCYTATNAITRIAASQAFAGFNEKHVQLRPKTIHHAISQPTSKANNNPH